MSNFWQFVFKKSIRVHSCVFMWIRVQKNICVHSCVFMCIRVQKKYSCVFMWIRVQKIPHHLAATGNRHSFY